jgi:hypothetical protein
MSKTDHDIIMESLELGLPVIDRLHHCMSAAREDELSRVREIVEKMIEGGESYRLLLNPYTEMERNRICIAVTEILKSLLNHIK